MSPELTLFVRVARTGSFSAAARELGLSQPSASRIVAELERELSAALVIRTTRAVKLTEAGSDYLAQVEPILAALEEADHAARGGRELRGLLRIGTSSSFGVREVIPRLPEFLAQHPHLRIGLAISDARQDLVAEGADLAFRLGTLTKATIIARKLGQGSRLVAASPGYLRSVPLPESPSDLAAHVVILGPGWDGCLEELYEIGAALAVRVEELGQCQRGRDCRGGRGPRPHRRGLVALSSSAVTSSASCPIGRSNRSVHLPGRTHAQAVGPRIRQFRQRAAASERDGLSAISTLAMTAA